MEAFNVNYVIVGGGGAQLHGAQRPTMDIDVVPDWTTANLERMCDLLRPRHRRVRHRTAGNSAQITPELLVDREITNWHTTVGHIDVMVGIPDADGGPVVFDELFERGVRMQLGRTWVVVADLADIVVSKEHANRAKDRQALPELYRLLETQRQPPPPSLGLER